MSGVVTSMPGKSVAVLSFESLSAVYAWNDELDQAFGTLSPLAKIPYGIYFGQFKLDPYWEPLRKDPRFEELLTERRRTDTTTSR